MPNGSSGIRLQHISSDFPKRLKLIRWTRAFESLSLGGNLTLARAGFGKPAARVPGLLPLPCSHAPARAARHTSATSGKTP